MALVQGTRICEFGTPFLVHEGLKWVEVADDTTDADTYVEGAVVKYVTPTPTAQDRLNKLEGQVTIRRVLAALDDEPADPGNDNLGGKGWITRQRGLIAVERAKL